MSETRKKLYTFFVLMGILSSCGCATTNPTMRVTFSIRVAGYERLSHTTEMGLVDPPKEVHWK